LGRRGGKEKTSSFTTKHKIPKRQLGKKACPVTCTAGRKNNGQMKSCELDKPTSGLKKNNRRKKERKTGGRKSPLLRKKEQSMFKQKTEGWNWSVWICWSRYKTYKNLVATQEKKVY